MEVMDVQHDLCSIIWATKWGQRLCSVLFM